MGDAVLLMFPALIVLIALGVPIAFSMVLVASVFGFIRFEDIVFRQFAQRVDEVASNYVLGAIPLFIFMGAILERAGIAEKLFDAIYMWTRRLPGGLAIAALVMCTIFAAASGVVGATETLVGMLAIPAMLKRKYNNSLVAGTICAGGSLGDGHPALDPRDCSCADHDPAGRRSDGRYSGSRADDVRDVLALHHHFRNGKARVGTARHGP